MALTAGRRGAGLAGPIPGLAYVVGTAAHLLGHVYSQLILTRAIIIPKAGTLPHVFG